MGMADEDNCEGTGPLRPPPPTICHPRNSQWRREEGAAGGGGSCRGAVFCLRLTPVGAGSTWLPESILSNTSSAFLGRLGPTPPWRAVPIPSRGPC